MLPRNVARYPRGIGVTRLMRASRFVSPAAPASPFASEANMSSDTNVVLVHRVRPARCTLPIVVGLLALAAPLLAQARPGHFYHVNYYQVRPGEEKAYDSALVSVVTPVFDELVKRKAVASYLLLTKTAGSGEDANVAGMAPQRGGFKWGPPFLCSPKAVQYRQIPPRARRTGKH